MWTMACTLIADTTNSEQAWPSESNQNEPVRNASRAVYSTWAGPACGTGAAGSTRVEPALAVPVSGGKPSMRWPTSSGRLRTMVASGQPHTISITPELKAATRQP